MKRKIHWLIINLVLLAGVTLVIAINLNSRLVEQEKTIKDMQWTIQEHELSIQRFAEQNTAQEVILNKLNREYQVQERKKAEAVKEAAEMNNVGGNNDQQCNSYWSVNQRCRATLYTEQYSNSTI